MLRASSKTAPAPCARPVQSTRASGASVAGTSSGLVSRAPRQATEAPPPSDVIILNGPGGCHFGKPQVEQMRSGVEACMRGGRLCVLGDGESEQRLESARASLRAAVEGQRDPLFIVHAHGDVDSEGTFRLLLDDAPKPATKLFQLLRDELGAESKATVYLQSCYSSAALRQADVLPQGTTLIALAPADRPIFAQETGRAWEAMVPRAAQDQAITADGFDLLFNYLFASGTSRPPSVRTGSGSVLHTEQLLAARAGRPFATSAREQVHARLDKLVSPARIDQLLRLVESKSLDELERGFRFPMAEKRERDDRATVDEILGRGTAPLSAQATALLEDMSEGGSDYGPCLAVCLAAAL